MLNLSYEFFEVNSKRNGRGESKQLIIHFVNDSFFIHKLRHSNVC